MAQAKPERFVDKLPRIRVRMQQKPARMTYGAIAGLGVLQSLNMAYLFMPRALSDVDVLLLVGANALALFVSLVLMVRSIARPPIPIEDEQPQHIGRHRRAD